MSSEPSKNSNEESAWVARIRMIVFAAAIIGPVLVGVLVFPKLNESSNSQKTTKVAADPRGLIRLPIRPTNSDSFNAPKSFDGKFLGAKSCQECHPEKYDTFVKTSHHQTSAPATPSSIKGKFEDARVIVQSADPELIFHVESKGDVFTQTAIVSHAGKAHSHSEQFEIVTGSGKLGQTYVYRKGSEFFQLPISYVSELSEWIYSPGYHDREADFSRSVNGACLVCHVTYFNNNDSEAESEANIVFGISCERCHGPGAQHADYHRKHPNEDLPKFISNPSDFKRDRQIDICGQCHSGLKTFLKRPFSFQPGDRLEEYMKLDSSESEDRLGVHAANQGLRLARSRCFQERPEMTCTTCHDPHVLQRGDIAMFSQKCQQCHTPDKCGMSEQLNDQFTNHCVECHMPLRIDSGTPFYSSTTGETYYPRMWDHTIGIYRKVTREKLGANLKKLKMTQTSDGRDRSD